MGGGDVVGAHLEFFFLEDVVEGGSESGERELRSDKIGRNETCNQDTPPSRPPAPWEFTLPFLVKISRGSGLQPALESDRKVKIAGNRYKRKVGVV